jgi:hypothetical protein
MVLAVEEDSRQREDHSYEHAEAFYRVNTERHFLVNAMHQLAKILNNVPWNISISEQLQGTIRDLRNALEHLDEWDAGHSFRRIRERAPFDEPTVIGGLSKAAPYLEVSSIQVPSSIPLALSSIR